MLYNRVVVFDYECANALYWNGYYGNFLGVSKPRSKDIKAPLELSLIEALYLLEKDLLRVFKGNAELSAKDLYELGASQIERFKALYDVYIDLRKRGFVVRRGLKFGCDYLLYRYGPGVDHAPFGVLVYNADDKVDPIELVRAGRLLHSVRKKLVVAIYDKGYVKYSLLDWWKP
ncbi:MAG: tRNA-intron lyase [Desulfurococcaceae archaeon]